MSPAHYLENLVYQQSNGIIPPYIAIAHFNPLISQWASGHLLETKLSGSHAKGTAVKICADVDIFISLNSNLNTSLSEIYESLFDFFASRSGYNPRKQNVSIRVNLGNSGTIDLVPGKRHPDYSNYHSLHVRKRQTWMQTNVDEHIRVVKDANLADVIKLTKIWRERHQLSFPSLYLELAVIRALDNNSLGDIADRFIRVLIWLGQNITSARFIDPANTNNVISDDLTISEKSAIERKAMEFQRASSWSQVVW